MQCSAKRHGVRSHVFRTRWWAVAALALGLCSCGHTPSGPPQKKTIPVCGEVQVDGHAVANVVVALTDLKGIDAMNPTFPKGITDAEGKFQIGTYTSTDGAPEGTYQLTFRWVAQQGGRQGARGPDRFRGRYNHPDSSQHQVTVTAGEPVELGVIALSSR